MYKLSETAKVLKNERKRRGISQKSATDAMGIDLSLLRDIEKGVEVPDVHTQLKLCDFYSFAWVNIFPAI